MSNSILIPASGPNFGIYVHWPFCEAKCPYCDFNSHVYHDPPDQNRFLAAFRTELAYFAGFTPNRTVDSIFIGGGTPSLMEPSTVESLLESIASMWSVAENVEVTMEANPSSVETNRFYGYRLAGVNRMSLGVQALNDSDLKKLGRLHDVGSAKEAISIARKHFDRVSFDLIYARPSQSVSDWQSELKAAIELATDHLSLYQLTIEPNTPYSQLHRAGKLSVPSADHCAEFYEATQEICDRNGLPAYEVSNHASHDEECRHNLLYWRYCDYVGTGPGAHGRLTIDEQKFATEIVSNPESWLKRVEKNGNGAGEFRRLLKQECGDEYLLMSLRMVEGLDLKRFEELSGRQLNSEKIDTFIQHGLLKKSCDERIKPTKKAFLLVNAIVSELNL